jgi:hypothetical protein
MGKRNDKPVPALSGILQAFAIPGNFFAGFVTGLVAPVAAVAAVVAGIRLLTGKVPFLGHVRVGQEGERHLSFKLVSPDQVGDLFAEQKEQIGGELGKIKAEIQVLIEEAKANAQTAGQEERQESPVVT